MQIKCSQIYIEDYKEKLARSLFNIQQIQYQKNKLVFLDTNILLLMYRINNIARQEFFGWLGKLKEENRLFVPSWVIHEYNKHLEESGEEVFAPYKKIGREVANGLKSLDKYSRLILDGESIKGTIYKDRNEVLKKLEDSTKEINSIINLINKSKSNDKNIIRQEIESLFKGCILDSDIYELIKEINNHDKVRFEHKLAPGSYDQWKDSNKFGDFIIWKEILLKCTEQKLGAVFITNDNKKDWVSKPTYIVKEGWNLELDKHIEELWELDENVDIAGEREKFLKKNTFKNDGQSDIEVILPQPSLVDEFKRKVQKFEDFNIINMEILVHLLVSNKYNILDFDKYENLASAIKAESKYSATHEVIKWFLDNEEKYRYAVKSVCYWGYSPSEISLESLKEFIEKELPNINVDEIDLNEITVTLFI